MKTVLLPLTAHMEISAISDFSIKFSQKYAATITALYVQADPRSAIPFVGEGLSGDMIQSIHEASQKEAEDQENKAKTNFANIMKQHDISERDSDDILPNSHYRWRTVTGEITDHVGRKARTFDVSLCMQPTADIDCNKHIFTDLIYRSGRPVLMLPASMHSSVGENLLVAWNGSAEITRSIANALPILRLAKSVTLIQVGEIDPDRPTLKDAAEYLADHGIKALTEEKLVSNHSIAETILDTATEKQADMVIIGAYSHARWRELILGSVTRQLITQTSLPIFMSH